MAVAPALAVSGAALGGGAVVRALRPTGGGGERRRGSPSLAFFTGNNNPATPPPRSDVGDELMMMVRAGGARGGGSGPRGAMRAAAASGKVVVPEGENDGLTSSTDSAQFPSDELEVPDIPEGQIESSETTHRAREADALNREVLGSALQEKPRVVPPPGDGQKIFQIDPMLQNYKYHLEYRYSLYRRIRSDIDEHEGGLEAFSRSYEKFGFNRSAEGVTYREWAPGAHSAALVGDFNNWDPNADRMSKNEFGVWEVFLPNNADGSSPIPHGSRVKVRMDTPSGIKDSIPAWIRYSVQAPGAIPYDGIYYDPPEEEPKINTYANFRDDVLPRIKKLGYNAVQIMAIQEHSYYGSFGYHVTNFFAPSSRFGTPEDLKSLIDRAHELGLLVLMDVVHSHASSNTLDGLNGFDGTDTHYFHGGPRGHHWMWDSRLFNYGNWEVIRFLLSNARWWLEEYKFDGFRFDGVTSMMYTHHGLQVAFTGNFNEYFGFATDVDAVVYLMLVNDLIHGLYPEAVTIGEDVSGMPTFALPVHDGGVGFDYRLHMAVADKWIELMKQSDESWKMGDIVHTLTNRRWLEKCVTYSESHDQALVGDKTIAFWLMDKDMYDFMALDRPSTPTIDRGIALHKMIRLITMGLGGEGYLNFMGNEFGHPEWIDFPRGPQRLPSGKFIPGNNNSYDKCRRRFDLGDADYLRYHGMQEFDQAMQHLEAKYGVCFMTDDHQYISRKHEEDKVALDSDAGLFGGFGRIQHAAEHFTTDCSHDNRPHSFSVYTPSRTCVVYAPAD
nr:unnamed protein product [Digitaria exilis]